MREHPDYISGRGDGRDLERDMELALPILSDQRGPAVSALRLGVALKVKDKDDSLADRSSLEGRRNSIDVGEVGGAAVLALNGRLQLSLKRVHGPESVWLNPVIRERSLSTRPDRRNPRPTGTTARLPEIGCGL